MQKDAFTLPLPENFSLDPVHQSCVVVTVGSGEAVQCSGILIVSPGMALLARTRSANLRSFQLIFKLQVGSNNHPTKLVSLMYFKEAEWLCSKCQPRDALTCLVHCCTCLSVGMMLRLRWSTTRPNFQYKDHLNGQLATHMSLLSPLSNLSATCKLAQNHHKPRIQPTKFLIAFGQQLLAQLACSKMDLMAKQTFSCLSLSIYISSLFEAPSSL